MWRLQLAQALPYTTPWSSASPLSCEQLALSIVQSSPPLSWQPQQRRRRHDAPPLSARCAVALRDTTTTERARHDDANDDDNDDMRAAATCDAPPPPPVDLCLLACHGAYGDGDGDGGGACVALHVDGRRVLLRRGDMQHVSPPTTTTATAAHVRLSRDTRRYTHDVDDEDSDDGALSPIYSTRWRHVSSTTLDDYHHGDHHDDNRSRNDADDAAALPDGSRAHRIRCYGHTGDDGSGMMRVGSGGSSSSSGGGCGVEYVGGDATTYATVLTASHAYQVQLANAGAALRVVRRARCVDNLGVGAICVDYWSADTVVVGLSDGTLRVLDWRLRSRHRDNDDDDNDGASVDATALPRIPVPQPPWLTQPPRRRGRGSSVTTSWSLSSSSSSSAFVPLHALTSRSRGGVLARTAVTSTSSAGAAATLAAPVLSCCAFEQSHRVVCGLGDARGAVVVADLRYSAPLLLQLREHARKRHRSTTAHSNSSSLRTAMLLAGMGCVPTGAAVCDVRACGAHSDRIGAIDARGCAFVTTRTALECGDAALLACSHSDDHDSGGGDCCSNDNDNNDAMAVSSTLPSPHSIATRLQRLGVVAGNTMSSSSRHDTVTRATAPRPSLRLRCAFAACGSCLVALQNVACTASVLHMTRHTALAYTLDVPTPPTPPPQVHARGRRDVCTSALSQQPFVAMASAGNVVALETATGDTLCVALDTS